jgi:hypothetical protein
MQQQDPKVSLTMLRVISMFVDVKLCVKVYTTSRLEEKGNIQQLDWRRR